jgi:hypothetical protein
MRELKLVVRFAPWWKHERVELVQQGGEEWLVGKGKVLVKDVFGHPEPWIPNTWELRKRVRSSPPKRVMTVHKDEGKERVAVDTVNAGLYTAFASIRSPEQALEFANRFGLLGLRKVTLDHEDALSFINARKTGRKDLTLPLPNGERVPLEQAREALMLSPEEFQQVITEFGGIIPIFYPERVSDWLKQAANLRRMLTPGEPEHRMASVAMHSPVQLKFLGGYTEFDYPSLRSALFLEARLRGFGPDEGLPRECAAPDCSRWFGPKYPDQQYCCPTCRKRAQNQKYYEERRKRRK